MKDPIVAIYEVLTKKFKYKSHIKMKERKFADEKTRAKTHIESEEQMTRMNTKHLEKREICRQIDSVLKLDKNHLYGLARNAWNARITEIIISKEKVINPIKSISTHNARTILVSYGSKYYF